MPISMSLIIEEYMGFCRIWDEHVVKAKTPEQKQEAVAMTIDAPVYRAKEPGSFSAEASAGKTHAVGDFGRESFQGVGSGGCPIPPTADWKNKNKDDYDR
jgi:hypothetical protein